MLELTGISKSFPTKNGRFQALSSVNLQIADGEFFSFVGPTGCGKTTLLKIINGLIAPSEGRLFLNGRELRGVSREMAFVFQDIHLLAWRSVVQNVEIGLEARGVGKTERRRRALETLALVGLEAVAEDPPYTLSGGMQQRVGVARALAVEPRVLLMDEPFGHLDNFTREVLQQELVRIWQQQRDMTVVFVTHSVNEAIFLSDRIGLFRTAPGRMTEVLDVGIPRPRDLDITDPRAIELRKHITRALDVRPREEVPA
ncbi:MAG: ABC transporter ATP-binding protein [Chloroflexota bacterium]